MFYKFLTHLGLHHTYTNKTFLGTGGYGHHFAKAFKHKNRKEEEEVQDHYATITKFKCPDNPNHVAQSMSFQLQDESHSPLPALQFQQYLISQTP